MGFALVLGPLVFIHELGHYLAGRLFGVRADVFSIGFGRELLGWTDRRGTRWKLSVLPLGGYVQFAGDVNPAGQPSAEWLSLPPEERAKTLLGRPLWQRAIIVLAGPLINLVAAVLILAGFAMAYGTLVAPPVIGMVAKGSAAEQAGLMPGDRVVSLLGSSVDTFLQIRMTVSQHPGEVLDVVVDRGGHRLDKRITPVTKVETDQFGNSQAIGFLGIAPATIERRPVGPLGALEVGVRQTRDIIAMTVTGIRQIVVGKRDVRELGGPIKIAKYSGEQFVSGWQSFVGFIALISINLGFINLLPIPVLDGGHLALFLAEAIRRKPISQRAQELAFGTGLVLVVALMLFVTFNDAGSLKLFGG
ncbi:peptidase RseP [Novosphingobium nitrogenifigens DSM 19370]|uniref:Zinc metalloprotease n=1 Tax=Novosphingobium nitrogenifigens DSM 19370 TaxID=983920 RepID=F1ZC81_9SPHN|nr:RIP metalloprotease RseP [Novosphingobium nitrogenifigens]EGD57712.1 peptidase RseP [Novosphingobium nitrogenifigens DSM 19370]